MIDPAIKIGILKMFETRHFLVLINQNGSNAGFATSHLPESSYDLTFVRATMPFQFAISADSKLHNILPQGSELVDKRKDILYYSVPMAEYRTVTCSSVDLQYSDPWTSSRDRRRFTSSDVRWNNDRSVCTSYLAFPNRQSFHVGKYSQVVKPSVSRFVNDTRKSSSNIFPWRHKLDSTSVTDLKNELQFSITPRKEASTKLDRIVTAEDIVHSLFRYSVVYFIINGDQDLNRYHSILKNVQHEYWRFTKQTISTTRHSAM